MSYFLFALLLVCFAVAGWFFFSRLSELSARLDYFSGVVDYLCTSIGRSDMSDISEELDALLSYCEDVPEDSGSVEVSSDDGSSEDVQC